MEDNTVGMHAKCACDHNGLEKGDTLYIESTDDVGYSFEWIRNIKYCPLCGKELPVFEKEQPKIINKPCTNPDNDHIFVNY